MESSPHSLPSIASAQDHEGSPEPCDIAQVMLVVMLFGDGEYSTDKMIWVCTRCKVPSSICYQFLCIVKHHHSDLFVGTVLH